MASEKACGEENNEHNESQKRRSGTLISACHARSATLPVLFPRRHIQQMVHDTAHVKIYRDPQNDKRGVDQGMHARARVAFRPGGFVKLSVENS